MSKKCLKCTCSAGVAPDPNVYQCEELSSVDTPYNWDDFVCDEAIVCTDPISNETHYPGASWFADKTDKCDEFCYCPSTGGTPVCETGFDAIIGSTNQALVGAFYEKCDYYLQGCANDGTRMIARVPYGSCDEYSCPKCDCDSHSVGDSYFTEYQSHKSQTIASCLSCQCTQSYDGRNYTECDESDTYLIGSGACPGPNTAICHNENGWGDCTGSDCTEKAIANHTLTPEACSSNAPSIWCGWDYQDDVNPNDVYYDWGCDESPFCSIYGANGQCFYGQYSASYTDCDGVTQTEAGNQYHYCCNDADNCNFVDIDTSSCTESISYSTLMQTLWTCLASNAGAHGMFFGDNCQSFTAQTTTCSAVSALFAATFDCYCDAYTTIYSDASAEWQPWIEAQIDVFATQFQDINGWSEVLGCGLNIQCDVTGATRAPTVGTSAPTTAAPTTAAPTPSCDYGTFEYDSSSQCMFNCEYDGNYVDPATLSFDFIAEQCDSVGNAARSGLCSTLDDLVWSTTGCSCPSCGCATVDEININSFESSMFKKCLNCTCFAVTASDPNVYLCKEIGSVDSPYAWNEFVCGDLSAVCTENISGEQHYPGNSWFADKELIDEKCDTFCYCTATGVTVCEIGFDAIIGSSNQALVDAFYDKCNWAIAPCASDGTRMLSTSGPSCDEWICPKCDCDSHSVGDLWYAEHVDVFDSNKAECFACECVESYGGNYTEYEYINSYLVGSGKICPDVDDNGALGMVCDYTFGVLLVVVLNNM